MKLKAKDKKLIMVVGAAIAGILVLSKTGVVDELLPSGPRGGDMKGSTGSILGTPYQGDGGGGGGAPVGVYTPPAATMSFPEESFTGFAPLDLWNPSDLFTDTMKPTSFDAMNSTGSASSVNKADPAFSDPVTTERPKDTFYEDLKNVAGYKVVPKDAPSVPSPINLNQPSPYAPPKADMADLMNVGGWTSEGKKDGFYHDKAGNIIWIGKNTDMTGLSYVPGKPSSSTSYGPKPAPVPAIADLQNVSGWTAAPTKKVVAQGPAPASSQAQYGPRPAQKADMADLHNVAGWTVAGGATTKKEAATTEGSGATGGGIANRMARQEAAGGKAVN